jgi:mono/diheme cytochrome c family protein
VGAAANYRVHCAACHGIGGRGDGWRARVSRLRMEDLTDSASMTALPDEYLFQVIKHGGANLGKPGMPSWGQALTDEEIRDLVAYIRALAPPVRQPESSGAAR